jgi:hypothetical protein
MWTPSTAGRPRGCSATVLYQDYHHNNLEWDVTMHGPVLGAAPRF